MYSKLLGVVLLSFIGVINGFLDTLSGQTGCLRPDLVSIEADVTDNDPSTMPESVSSTRNFDRLWIIFSTDVTSEDKAQEYIDGLKGEYDCISEADDNTEGKYIYYHPRAGQYSAFLNVESGDSDGDGTSSCCIDSGEITYDDYGISHIDYDLTLSTNTLRDLECIEEFQSTFYWNLNIIDTEFELPSYTHPDTASNIATNNVDIYILDSGVRSTHNNFFNTEVIHGDPNFGDDEITSDHGTHVAGTAGGYFSGSSKGLPIYEYAVCRYGSGCAFQDILNGYSYVYNQLLANPGRRGVINMSFGAYYGASFIELYYDFIVGDLENIYDSGGILVAAAGNSGADACGAWPAAADFVLSVGSAYIAAASWFSNYGECVDIYAPGSEVYSSTAFFPGACTASDFGYDFFQGTSMASPLIAGVVANMLSLNDELTFEEIKDIIVNSKDNYKLANCLSESNGIDCYSFAMACDDLVSESQFAAFEFDCSDVQDENACDNMPCDCNGGDDDSLEFCNICNQGSGCAQCQGGYIKIDSNHGCVNCQDYFGDNCMHCSDGIGCQQCGNNVQRVYDNTCGLYYCPDE